MGPTRNEEAVRGWDLWLEMYVHASSFMELFHWLVECSVQFGDKILRQETKVLMSAWAPCRLVVVHFPNFIQRTVHNKLQWYRAAYGMDASVR